MSIFFNNIRAVFTNPVKVFIIIFMPIIFILLFIYGEGENVPTRVIIIDNDNTRFTQCLIDELDKGIKIVDVDMDSMLDTMINCEADYAIAIEEGFTEELFSGDEPKIKEQFFIGEEKLYSVRNGINIYLNSAKGLYAISENEDDFYSKLNKIDNYNVVYNSYVKEKMSAVETVQALGFIVQFIIYSTIIIVACIMVDKEENITPRILSSPISAARYLGEHFLSYIVMEAVIVTVLMATLSLLFGYSFYGNFGIILIMMMLFAVSVTALSIMVLSLSKKSKVFYWAMICMTTPLMLMGGCYFKVENMPEIVQNISKFLPTTWIMNFLRDVLQNNDASRMGITAIVFGAFIVLFISISRIGLKRLLRAE